MEVLSDKRRAIISRKVFARATHSECPVKSRRLKSNLCLYSYPREMGTKDERQVSNFYTGIIKVPLQPLCFERFKVAFLQNTTAFYSKKRQNIKPKHVLTVWYLGIFIHKSNHMTFFVILRFFFFNLHIVVQSSRLHTSSGTGSECFCSSSMCFHQVSLYKSARQLQGPCLFRMYKSLVSVPNSRRKKQKVICQKQVMKIVLFSKHSQNLSEPSVVFCNWSK